MVAHFPTFPGKPTTNSKALALLVDLTILHNMGPKKRTQYFAMSASFPTVLQCQLFMSPVSVDSQYSMRYSTPYISTTTALAALSYDVA